MNVNLLDKRRSPQYSSSESEEEREEDFDRLSSEIDCLSPEESAIHSALLEAVVNEDLRQAKLALDDADAKKIPKGIIINSPSPYHRSQETPLLLAFGLGNLPIATLLISAGGDPLKTNSDDQNAFHLACMHVHLDLIDLLITRGVLSFFGPCDESGCHALHVAAVNDVSVLRHLLDKGFLIDSTTSDDKLTPLSFAIIHHELDNVRELITRGANVNKCNSRQMSPLMHAVDLTDVSLSIVIVKLLLETKADFNKPDVNGWLPIDLAEARGNIPAFWLLHAKGARPSVLPANRIPFQSLHFEHLNHKGESPGSIFKVGNATIGSTLYIGGGVAKPAEDSRINYLTQFVNDLSINGNGARSDLSPSDSANIPPSLEVPSSADCLEFPFSDNESKQKSFLEWPRLKDLYSTDLNHITYEPMADFQHIVQTTSHLMKFDLQGAECLVVNDTGLEIEVDFSLKEPILANEDATHAANHAHQSESHPNDHVQYSDHDTEEHHDCCPSMSDNDKQFATSVMANLSYPSPWGKDKHIAYYEVTVIDAPSYNASDLSVISSASDGISPINPSISLGFTALPEKWKKTQHPGWILGSIGYHSDDGVVRVAGQSSYPPSGPLWGRGDVIGAGYTYADQTFFFTLNGSFLGCSFPLELLSQWESIPDFESEFESESESSSPIDSYEQLFAVLGFGSDRVKVRVNFGQTPFRFHFHLPTLTWKRCHAFPHSIMGIVPAPNDPKKLVVIFHEIRYFAIYDPEVNRTTMVDTGKDLPIIDSCYNYIDAWPEMNKILVFIHGAYTDGTTEIYLYILDLKTKKWTNIFASNRPTMRILVQRLRKCKNPSYSALRLGHFLYIFYLDKHYKINLNTLNTQNLPVTNFKPSDHVYSSLLSDDKALVYTQGPTLRRYRLEVLDLKSHRTYFPHLSGGFVPSLAVGGFNVFSDKIFIYSGFEEEDFMVTAPSSMLTLNYDPTHGLSRAFNGINCKFASDFQVILVQSLDVELDHSSGKESGQFTRQHEEELHLHRSILFARSSVFEALFKVDPTTKSYEFHCQSNWNLSLVRTVFKYLYSDTINGIKINDADVDQLMEIVREIAPEHHVRILEECSLGRTLAPSTLTTDLEKLHQDPFPFSDLAITFQGITSRTGAMENQLECQSSTRIHVHQVLLLSSHSVASRCQSLIEKCTSTPASIIIQLNVRPESVPIVGSAMVKAIYSPNLFSLDSFDDIGIYKEIELSAREFNLSDLAHSARALYHCSKCKLVVDREEVQ